MAVPRDITLQAGWHKNNSMKVFVVFGTRPEAVKMCPLVMELRKHDCFDVRVCLTGQHSEMLYQVMSAFSLKADYDLEIMKRSQTLTSITASILEKLDPILEKELPDVVLVHGDTSTSFAAALASFYKKIPVGHVEAGLRTYNIYSPFPEEMNRQLTDQLSSYHFAPTQKNRCALLKQGIDEHVYVTGNTVIDAFEYTVKDRYVFEEPVLNKVDFAKNRIVLVTAHRRENLGKPLENICLAIRELAPSNKDVVFVYPVHLNPAVKDTAQRLLSGIDNVRLISPISVIDMHNLLYRCFAVMTDSGGLQEEAPHFGKPVLVLREETEREEAVEAGTVRVVGTDKNEIVKQMDLLLHSEQMYSRMSNSCNPYGDGKASARIADILKRISG